MLLKELEVSTRSVKELRQELKALKDQMLSTQQGSEDYNKALQKAANIQHELKEQMQQVNNSAMDFGQKMSNAAKSMAGITGAVTAATGAMSLFGIENDEVAQKVTATMSALIGITQGLQAMDNGVKAFKALTIAVNASTGAVNGLKAALIASGLGALAVLIGTIVAKWNDWVVTTREEARAIAEVNYALKNLNEDLADEEMMLAYHIEQKKIQGKTEKEILEYENQELYRLKELAQAKYDEITANMALITSEKELEEARKAQEGAQREINSISRRIQQNFLNQSLAIERQNHKDKTTIVQDSGKKLITYERDLSLARLDEEKKYSKEAYDIHMKYFDSLFKIYKKDSEDYRNLVLEKTRFDKEWENHFKDVLKEFDNSQKTESQKLEERYALLVEAAEREGRDLTAIKKWYADEQARIDQESRQADIDLLTKFYDDEIATAQEKLDQRYTMLIDAALKEGKDTETIYEWYIGERQKIEDQAHQADRETLAAWDQEQLGEFDQLRAQLDERYTILMDAALAEGRDTTELFKWYEEEKTKIENKELDKQAKLRKAQIKSYGNYANAIGDCINNIGEMLGEGTKAQKGMAIAATTIQMLVGIATALSGAFTTKSGPWDIALAAIQAASIAASGIASIAKIQQVKEDGTESGGGGSYVPSISIPSVVGGSGDFTQTVDGAVTENAISDQKVYVLEHDITETQTKVEVETARAVY